MSLPMKRKGAETSGAGEPNAASVRAWLYDAGGTDCEVAIERAHPERLKRAQLLWVDVARLDRAAEQAIKACFGIEPRLLARITDDNRKVVLDNYGDYFALSVLLAPDDERDAQRCSFIIGRNWLVTLSKEASPELVADFRRQDKGETRIGRLTSTQLLAALLDWHLAAFFTKVSTIEARVDRLDEKILHEKAQGQILRDMVAIRRSISALRRILSEQRPVFYALARPDIAALLPDETNDAFHRLGERLERAIDEVERTRDVLVGSFDLFTSLSAQTTNELVKALTFATVVIGVFAAVAGLLGMNFEMALFKTGTTGFLFVVATLSILSGAALFFAKRRGWI